MRVVYTDGSCIGNPWPWWWASIISSENSENSEFFRDHMSDGKELFYEEKTSEVVLQGRTDLTTNNIMELTACLEALKWLYTTCSGSMWQYTDGDMQEGLFAQEQKPRKQIDDTVLLTTDSTYVKMGITAWIQTWKRRHRKRTKWGKLIENVLLRKELDALVACFTDLRWEWTKAHVGTVMNERVDQLAREMATSD